MSFPATGFAVMYRNKQSDVIKYLEEAHENHYRVYNLSNKEYDGSKFGDYKFYSWEDHHAPQIHILFEICRDMYEFMKSKTI